jgi:hypothetical protein
MQQTSIGQGVSQEASARRALGPVAVGAIALAVVLAAIGTYADRSDSDHHATREFLIVCAIIAVASALVFGWIVPRMLARASLGTPALVLAVLGFVTVLVFWSGLPPVLAAGGGLLGWAGRTARLGAGRCRVAMAIAALAVMADVLVLVGDTTNSI